MSVLRSASLLVAAAFLLAGCADKDHQPLPGKRISVLELDKQLEPDSTVLDLPVSLPKPETNESWPLAGGNAAHDVGHPALGDPLKRVWMTSIGDGSSRHGALIASPVTADGSIYVMDARRLVSSFSTQDGHLLWRTDVAPHGDHSHAWGGGIAFANGLVFAATGYGEVMALDAKDGHVAWRVSLEVPIHSSPTIANGRLFVVTTDAQLVVLSVKDGHELWRYADIAEPAVLAGNASPAVANDVVVAPFASGDVVALRVDNGLPLWSDNLTVTRHFDALSTLADIHGAPVIDAGTVFVVGHSGEVVAIDLRTGARNWDQQVGGVSQPWVAGNFVYLLSSNGALVCLTRAEGKIRWITQLQRRLDPTSRTSKPIIWTGPLLAGDRLVVVSSREEAWSISPYTGVPLGKLPLAKSSFIAPIVAGNTLYLLADDASLMALQ